MQQQLHGCNEQDNATEKLKTQTQTVEKPKSKLSQVFSTRAATPTCAPPTPARAAPPPPARAAATPTRAPPPPARAAPTPTRAPPTPACAAPTPSRAPYTQATARATQTPSRRMPHVQNSGGDPIHVQTPSRVQTTTSLPPPPPKISRTAASQHTSYRKNPVNTLDKATPTQRQIWQAQEQIKSMEDFLSKNPVNSKKKIFLKYILRSLL